MSMTIEDVKYEMYLEGLHESYIESLEKLANSKNIKELKENLEGLKETKASIEKWMGRVDEKNIENLSQALQEISTFDNIYKVIIGEKKNNKIYFLIGLSLAMIGILVSIFL